MPLSSKVTLFAYSMAREVSTCNSSMTAGILSLVRRGSERTLEELLLPGSGVPLCCPTSVPATWVAFCDSVPHSTQQESPEQTGVTSFLRPANEFPQVPAHLLAILLALSKQHPNTISQGLTSKSISCPSWLSGKSVASTPHPP